MNFLTRTLGPAVLLVCALSPALVAATSAVPKEPERAACVHLKGALAGLHRALERASPESRPAIRRALLDLYQTDRYLGCSS